VTSRGAGLAPCFTPATLVAIEAPPRSLQFYYFEYTSTLRNRLLSLGVNSESSKYVEIATFTKTFSHIVSCGMYFWTGSLTHKAVQFRAPLPKARDETRRCAAQTMPLERDTLCWNVQRRRESAYFGVNTSFLALKLTTRSLAQAPRWLLTTLQLSTGCACSACPCGFAAWFTCSCVDR
jgi:hypothetical protein